MKIKLLGLMFVFQLVGCKSSFVKFDSNLAGSKLINELEIDYSKGNSDSGDLPELSVFANAQDSLSNNGKCFNISVYFEKNENVIPNVREVEGYKIFSSLKLDDEINSKKELFVLIKDSCLNIEEVFLIKRKRVSKWEYVPKGH